MNDELRQQVEEARQKTLQAARGEIAAICEKYGVSLQTTPRIADGRIIAEIQLVSNG